MTRRERGDLGGGFLLGASLGLVFAPCAGPVFAAVSVNAGTHRVGFSRSSSRSPMPAAWPCRWC